MGHIEQLPSGSYRVSVAGTDPLTRQEIRLRSTVKGELQAQIELGRLLKEAPEGRTPESTPTMAGLMDQYAAIAEWDVSTRQTNEGFIRRTIKPALGHLEVRKVRGPILDKLYTRRKRCGDLSCTRRPFTQVRRPQSGRPPGDKRVAHQRMGCPMEMAMEGHMTTEMPNHATRSGAFADPVFVLCAGGFGSTLLSSMLDAHPDLACPPDMNLAPLCTQLATVWSLLEAASAPVEPDHEPPPILEAAVAGTKNTTAQMVSSYLARRGKKRYCDKSPGTARSAELLLRIYPNARFLCLYRHPMDVIASGVEAFPWELDRYGLVPYLSSSRPNFVRALARFWADNVADILRAEERFPHACHRVRYEDMVSNPEVVAAGIFRFLGVPHIPGISESCFAGGREPFRSADCKIVHTSQVAADSALRGWIIPVALIAPHVLKQMDELAAKLQYVLADEMVGNAAKPAGRLRRPASGQATGLSPDLPQASRPRGANGQRPHDTCRADPAAANSRIGALADSPDLTNRQPAELPGMSEDPNAGRPCCCETEHFTETEIEVLCLVADGLSNAEIAGRMSVSGHTVDRHVTHMLQRSGARNRAGLVSAAFRAGILVANQYELRPSGRRCLLG
jgi:DNA-binding CsgD family transcriptional regulator